MTVVALRAALVLGVVAAILYLGLAVGVFATGAWLAIMAILAAMVWAAASLIRGR